MRFALALAALALTLLVGCGGNPDPNFAVDSCDVQVINPGHEKDIKPLNTNKDYSIEFETTEGNFTVEIDPKRAPCNGNSMLQLARDGFFDGIPFHRIVPGFIIQGGHSPKTPDGGPGYSTVDSPLPDTLYPKGSVAMAKAPVEEQGTGGSEFFIVTGSNVNLPPDYAPLGHIVKGMDVVEKIGKMGNPRTERPTKKIVIKRAKESGL